MDAKLASDASKKALSTELYQNDSIQIDKKWFYSHKRVCIVCLNIRAIWITVKIYGRFMKIAK